MPNPNQINMINPESLIELAQALAQSGLKPVSVIEVEKLPTVISDVFPRFGNLSHQKQIMLLVGNSGRRFWESLIRSDFVDAVDPVDAFSSATIDSVLDSFLPGVDRRRLYPQTAGGSIDGTHIPLQALGQLAGWHQPSPLGIGIHPEHGLWFAYRAVVVLDCSLPLDMDSSAQSESLGKYIPALYEIASLATMAGEVCSACKTQDCVVACPAGAVQFGETPDMQRCSRYRLEKASVCKTQCLARNACPEGETSRYHDDQIKHHYSISLSSIKAHFGKNALQ